MFHDALKSIFLILLILFPLGFTLMPVAGGSKSHQLLGAFFDPEYGHYRKWNMSGQKPPLSWASNFLPSIYETRDPAGELYDSNDTRVILWQLGKMKQAGLDFVASFWQGRGSYDDRVLEKILFEVMPRQDNPYHELKWAIEYEAERFSNPSIEELVKDMQYLKTTMAASSNLLRIHDRIVIFVRGGGDDEIAYVHKWSEMAKRVGGLYLILKVFPGSSAVADAVDGWYEFAPANRIQYDAYYWGYVSPGFSMFNDSTRKLSRNLNEFAVALERLRESNAHFALIETWNDWCEGTQIEPGFDRASGENYGDAYVDMVRQVMKDNLSPISHHLPAILGVVLVTVAIVLVLFPTAYCRMKNRGVKHIRKPDPKQ
jgi:hypothetical protein